MPGKKEKAAGQTAAEEQYETDSPAIIAPQPGTGDHTTTTPFIPNAIISGLPRKYMGRYQSALEIPQSHQQRIFDTVRCVIDTTLKDCQSDHDSTTACVLYAILTAAILEHHYGILAIVFCGAAAITIGAEGLIYGTFDPDTGDIIASGDGFHSWVAAGTEDDFCLIDTSLGVLPENFSQRGRKYPLTRSIVWRKYPVEPFRIAGRQGAMTAQVDLPLTDKLIEQHSNSSAVKDMVAMTLKWYGEQSRSYQPPLTFFAVNKDGSRPAINVIEYAKLKLSRKFRIKDKASEDYINKLTEEAESRASASLPPEIIVLDPNAPARKEGAE